VSERVVDKRYRLVRQLGRGGMGVVYEALNLRSNRTVALKLLATNVGEEMPDVNARFEREVRATSSLDSDNIVRVYDAGTDEESGAPYMVMELVRGSSTATSSPGTSSSPSKAARWCPRSSISASPS
jgi:eukaryotic-like serine/threonine-protein kinase